jgi:sugar lactone lactonase YvrE
VSAYLIRGYDVDCVVDCRNKLGEGAFWCPEERVVYWLDVPMPSILHRFDPVSGRHDSWPMSEMSTAMAKRRDGSLLIASQGGINIFDVKTGKLNRAVRPESDKPGNRSNDGAPDARGRFWIGTMQNNIAPDGSDLPLVGSQGSLWRIDPDFGATRMVDRICIPNGIVWSPDHKTLYLVDSMIQTIFAYDFDLERGTISNRRVFSEVKDLGYPDCSAVDAEGYVWNARWAGSAVVRLATDGRIDRVVPMPAERVTSCAFGGEDLGTLYVTTSRLHIDADSLARHPRQGGLFAFGPGVKGLPRTQFAG